MTTDGKGQKTLYSYDVLDRLLSVKYYGAGATSSGCTVTGTLADSVTNTYDDDGNTKTRVDSDSESGTSSFNYDPLNRLTSEAEPGTRNTSYGYDNASNLTTVTDGGGTTTYGYDGANEAITMQEPGGNCAGSPATLCTTFGYNADGQETLIKYPSGATVNSHYDTEGRLDWVKDLSPSSAVIRSFTYCYTLPVSATCNTSPTAGQDTALRQTMKDENGNITYYTYDSLSRLTQAQTKNSAGTVTGTYTYGYDGNGNRISESHPGGSSTSTFNQDNVQYGTGYTFDANGNETAAPRDGGVGFTYNPMDQLTNVNIGGTSQDHQYFGLGQGYFADDGSGPLSWQENALGTSVATTPAVPPITAAQPAVSSSSSDSPAARTTTTSTTDRARSSASSTRPARSSTTTPTTPTAVRPAAPAARRTTSSMTAATGAVATFSTSASAGTTPRPVAGLSKTRSIRPAILSKGISSRMSATTL